MTNWIALCRKEDIDREILSLHIYFSVHGCVETENIASNRYAKVETLQECSRWTANDTIVLCK